MKVGVIMGGTSSEKQVSIMTGKEMVAHLNKQKYDVVEIVLEDHQEVIEKVQGIDVALLALHGKFGEDGTIQGVLETLGIPYTGSGLLASSLCMDKNMAKKILRYEGIATPDWMHLVKGEELTLQDIELMGYPLVVKPNAGGSSVGVQIVHDRNALLTAVTEVLKWDNEIIIEQYMIGDEVTCPILNDKLLPVLSIKHTAVFFDYQAKYDDASTIEEPMELPLVIHDRVAKAAMTSYKSLKCSVYARVDMLIKEGVPYVLEVNTLPGMTQNSLLPKSALAAGISYSALLDSIIDSSLQIDNR
ncbi:D-alanine--D-alanine ligase [Lysinibacillus fusiformis]|uniref:D-alanine--D-alanine ligase n=1 Tax=Lysinibacillus fusiformis TaxID=28031 RepID=UPI00215A5FAB|nr:D-alanine--D-alanine ligase [Lysinibacillus fusiformis]MCR8853711.1 D-alanine--D-alanine ligase [Lysinibacillus fusiformis]WKT76324.1 D-alanine--D-alanine ligase [Lysinibacillus fusiformis]WKT79891.1 D-alanine--D-alanine ligase [Lysinibacillus fusiformis]